MNMHFRLHVHWLQPLLFWVLSARIVSNCNYDLIVYSWLLATHQVVAVLQHFVLEGICALRRVLKKWANVNEIKWNQIKCNEIKSNQIKWNGHLVRVLHREFVAKFKPGWVRWPQPACPLDLERAMRDHMELPDMKSPGMRCCWKINK